MKLVHSVAAAVFPFLHRVVPLGCKFRKVAGGYRARGWYLRSLRYQR